MHRPLLIFSLTLCCTFSFILFIFSCSSSSGTSSSSLWMVVTVTLKKFMIRSLKNWLLTVVVLILLVLLCFQLLFFGLIKRCNNIICLIFTTRVKQLLIPDESQCSLSTCSRRRRKWHCREAFCTLGIKMSTYGFHLHVLALLHSRNGEHVLQMSGRRTKAWEYDCAHK